MQDRDEQGSEVCAGCGRSVAAGSEQTYAFGDENFLCAGCAVDRGGRYDEARDVWAVTPDLSGLPDEAYGAAPHERERRR